jgi:undecaprenyl-diphosphatase
MIGALYATFETIQDTVSKTASTVLIDISANLWMASHVNETVVDFMKIITNVFSPISISVLAVIAVLIYVYHRKWEQAAFLVLSLGGVFAWISFIKDLVMRLRPENMLVVYTDYSFPSLHAGMAAFACLAFIYLYAIRIKSLAWREAAIVFAFLISILVGFSRVYLNVHWLSDVTAGYSVAVLWVTMMVLFAKYLAALLKPSANQ